MNYIMFAPAKINLGLEILKKLPNGYHKLSTIMQTINLCDIITVKTTKSNNLLVVCDKELDCKLTENTAYLAAEYFFKYSKIKPVGLYIKIEKKIPSCAGLAGGSADAATVLLLLNKIFETNFTKNQLIEIAEKIGSDVPFCLFGGTSHLIGTGANIKNLKSIPKCYVIIIKPEISISTKSSYTRIKPENFSNNRTFPLLKAIKNENLKDISKNLFNIFEEVLPKESANEILKIKKILLENSALGAQMTGSGSAVFGIFENETTADLCFQNIKKTYSETFLCKPI